MALFPEKSVTLAANAASSITWSGSDFMRVLNEAQPVEPLSLGFTITNGTNQVCYISLSYTTRAAQYAVNERRSIAAVPALGSLRITPAMVPALGSIGPDLISLTVFFLSAAAGTIVALLEAVDASSSGGSGGSYQGLDDRSALDYIFVPLTIGYQSVAANTTVSATYNVPAGKRAKITGIYVHLDRTALNSQFTAFIDVNGSTILSFTSQMETDVNVIMNGDILWILNSADQLVIRLFNNINVAAHQGSMFVTLQEVF